MPVRPFVRQILFKIQKWRDWSKIMWVLDLSESSKVNGKKNTWQIGYFNMKDWPFSCIWIATIGSTHFQDHPRSKLSIFEIVHFQCRPLSRPSNFETVLFRNRPLSKPSIFEIVHFRCRPLSRPFNFETVHFRNRPLWWPSIFDIVHFLCRPLSRPSNFETVHFETVHFQKSKRSNFH